jgi:hypothetical protein
MIKTDANQVSSTSLMLDKAAIGLSTLCAIHCLFLPVALTMLPSLALMPVGEESFHLLLVCLVLPTSIIALTLGCRRHKERRMLLWGGAGLIVLVVTAALGHDFFGEVLEKSATVLGTILVATAHFINYRCCRTLDCHD